MSGSVVKARIWEEFGWLYSELGKPENKVAASWIRVIPVENDADDVMVSPTDNKPTRIPLKTTADLLRKGYEETLDLLVAAGRTQTVRKRS